MESTADAHLPAPERPGADEVAAAARAAAALLTRACPDTGDQTTQLALDDVLDLVERRLAALVADGAAR